MRTSFQFVWAFRFDRRLVFTLLAAVVPFFVYLASAMPDVGLWDTGEMQTVPYIFGIAHPTGFPLFVLLGFVWSHVLFFLGTPAYLMTLLSAACTACSSWLLARTLIDNEDLPPVLAICAALAFAFGEIVWTRSTRTEIHTAALLASTLAFAFAQRARSGSRRSVSGALVALAAGLAIHPVVLWTIPGIALLLFDAFRMQPQLRANWLQDVGRGAAIGVLVFVTSYMTIPIRSAEVYAARIDPTLALGMPPGRPFWDYGHPSTPQGFLHMLDGAQFEKRDGLSALIRIEKYPLYLLQFCGIALRQTTPLGVIAFLFGAYSMFRDNRYIAAAYLTTMLAGLPFALSYSIEIDNERYLLFLLWMYWYIAAVGIEQMAFLLTKRFPAIARLAQIPAFRSIEFFGTMPTVEYDHKGEATVGRSYAAATRADLDRIVRTLRHSPAGGVGIAATGIALAACLILLSVNHTIFAQKHNHEGRHFIRRVLTETPKNAIIVSAWVYATPLAYAAYVEHHFGKRILVTAEPQDIADRFPQWRRHRPVYIIDDSAGTGTMAGIKGIAVDQEFPRIVRVSGPSLPANHVAVKRRAFGARVVPS